MFGWRTDRKPGPRHQSPSASSQGQREHHSKARSNGSTIESTAKYRRTSIMSSRVALRSLLGGAVISLFFIATWSTTASRLSSLTTTGSAGKASLAAHKPAKPAGSKIRSALVQSAPTVTTNYIDYQPGDTVVITGAGWAAGETVALTIVESDGDAPWLSQATADSSGDIYSNQFVIQSHDHGVSFTLTAKGQTSGLTATTTFTDNVTVDFQQSANNEPPSPGFPGGLGN